MTRRRAAAWTAFFLLVAVAGAWASTGLRSDSRAIVFLRPDDAARGAYEDFVARFGEDTFLVVTCRGDGSPTYRMRVEALAADLRASPEVRAAEVPAPGSPLARALALSDAEGRRLSLLVALAAGGPAAVDAVRATVDRYPDLHAGLAGQPALNVALKRASDTVGRRLFPLLALAMALLVQLAYRSARVTLAVFAVTGVSLLSAMAIVALSGRPVNLVTILLPVLLLALTVALCIHLVNAYRIQLATGRTTAEAVRAMRREELRPCLVTSLTTAAGFGSFGLSHIEPLQVLGIAMAVSILWALVVALTLLPALLTLAAPRPREGLRIGERLVRLVPGLLPGRGAILAILALGVGGAALAAPRVGRETNGLHYLPTAAPLRTETARLAEEGVGTASVELVFRAGEGRPLADLEAPLRTIEERLEGWSDAHVRGAVTPLTLAREAAFRLRLPAAAPLEHAALGPVPGALGAALDAYRDVATRSARVSVRIDPLDVAGYRDLRSRLDTAAAEALRAAPGATCVVTGEFPIVMRVQEDLLDTLLVSLAGTAATITVILALAARSLRLALLTLLPAALPLAFVLVACAAFGVPLSIATVMVLAVTLGIVTDDSVHMLEAFRCGLPLDQALRRVGTAVTETSIAIFLGFAVLGWAEFTPTRDFGLLTAGAIVVALLADLVLFPALLRPRATALRAPSPALALAPLPAKELQP